MSVYLFPHSNPPEDIIKRVTSFFGPMKMCLPWFMEPPTFINEAPVEILYPPDNLRPKDTFKAILSEYRFWVKQNQDRTYWEIIKSDRSGKPEDEATWNIRHMITRGVESISDSEEDLITRRHLVLHLEGEMEEQQASADSILRTLKNKRSPLEGSLEKKLDINGLFEDLPGLDSDSSLTDLNLAHLIEAWLGLFHRYIEEKGLLITLNSRIMDFLSERWSELTDYGSAEGTLLIDIPDLSCHTPDEIDGINREYRLRDRLKEIKEIIIDLNSSPLENINSLDILGGELHDLLPSLPSKELLRCTLKYFYPPANENPLNSNILKHLSGNTLIMVKKEVHQVNGHSNDI
jgi:hypothetical protein